MPLLPITREKNLAGKRVLVRVDFNVPVKKGQVLDLFRIERSVATITYLREHGARVIVVAHRGRPKGVDPELSLKPVARAFEQLIRDRVKLVPVTPWSKVVRSVAALNPGQVLMLENIRFLPDEQKNTGVLAKQLAALADIFVLDGFGVAHRPAASVSGIAKHVTSYAGLLLAEEINGLTKVMKTPKRPLVVLLGGAKTETKLPVLEHLLPKANYILVSGGIFNTYLAAKGFNVGCSIVQPEYKKQVLKYAKTGKLIFPVDMVVGKLDGSNAKLMPFTKNFSVKNKSEAICDIGPATIQLFAEFIKRAETLIWNGAMGKFEVHPYEYGTYSLTHLFAARSKGKAFGVCGGGETVQVFQKLGVADQVDLVSTGGGAMLEFLSGKKLPGIAALGK